jgi:hypothetical protein
LTPVNLYGLDEITISSNCANTKAKLESVSEDKKIVLTLLEKAHQEDDPNEEDGASKGERVALVAETPDSIHPNTSTRNNKKTSERSPGEIPVATATPITNLDLDLTTLESRSLLFLMLERLIRLMANAL